MNPMHGERRPGSVGLRLPYTEVRIADVAGDGTIRGDCRPRHDRPCPDARPAGDAGYLDSRHDRADADRWLARLGRSRRLDVDGYVWLTGRSKDLIIRGGHNITRS